MVFFRLARSSGSVEEQFEYYQRQWKGVQVSAVAGKITGGFPSQIPSIIYWEPNICFSCPAPNKSEARSHLRFVALGTCQTEPSFLS